MIKKTVTYTNFDGVSVTEDLYFNLTTAEILNIETTTPGGFSNRITEMFTVDASGETHTDANAMYAVIKDIIEFSYGVKSADGRRFTKNAEVLADFLESNAYSEVLMSLITNGDELIEFLNGVFPADLAAKAESIAAQNPQVPINPRIAAMMPNGGVAGAGLNLL